MACSRFEYVKAFEQADALLPATYIVVRLDGRGFSRFTADHGYAKPNDARGLALMNQCAAHVMREWGDAVLAFGESDEYSFVFPRGAGVFGRRAAKLATGIASLFAASFVFYWPRFFPGCALRGPPAFDARCVAYPTLRIVCDYVKWRQVDAHVNALHNEAFWALVLRGGLAPAAAFARLSGSLSDDKHELLRGFGVNYARLPLLFRRGTTLLRSRDAARLLLDGGARLDGVPVLGESAEAHGVGASSGEELGESAEAPTSGTSSGGEAAVPTEPGGSCDGAVAVPAGQGAATTAAHVGAPLSHEEEVAAPADKRRCNNQPEVGGGGSVGHPSRRSLHARFLAAARTAGCGLDSDAWGVSPRFAAPHASVTSACSRIDCAPGVVAVRSGTDRLPATSEEDAAATARGDTAVEASGATASSITAEGSATASSINAEDSGVTTVSSTAHATAQGAGQTTTHELGQLRLAPMTAATAKAAAAVGAAAAAAAVAAVATAVGGAAPPSSGEGDRRPGALPRQPPPPPPVLLPSPPVPVELPPGVVMAFPDFLRCCRAARAAPAPPARVDEGAAAAGGGGGDARGGASGGGDAHSSRREGGASGRRPPPLLFLEALLTPYDD